MKANYILTILIVSLEGFGFKSEKPPIFEKIHLGFLLEYNEGGERWTDGKNNQIKYFQKVKDSKLIDEEFIFTTGDEYYKLNSRNLGKLTSSLIYKYEDKGSGHKSEAKYCMLIMRKLIG